MVSLISMLMTLIIMAVAFFIMAGLGGLGIPAFGDLKNCAAYAMAGLFVFTAGSHFFSPVREDLINMVPDFFPFPVQIVFITGILECLGAVGLIIPTTRRAAGTCLILLLIGMFPANIYAALNNIPLLGEPATPLWLRIPEQLVYIGMILWAILPTARIQIRTEDQA
ncbi:hypothetical protein KSF_081560 [Reticulibacter mediterranei]|uniref:DoxX family protein n=1 Tax=Reticulibacter mediterranei TaxID=2778369 RepID=A0A8J3N703_9CHLR|nr:hypothetical protein [Reticulibacter mediterranei]GHO98108.1 hypothetical protein KSF_081560 [Reticulibacter mediterranei]